jgi:hypothetical protein
LTFVGVLFVGFKEDRVAVVKSSSTAMADYFVSELGKMVQMPFPDFRIVRWQIDKEISVRMNFTLADTLKAILTVVDDLSRLKKEGEKRKVSKVHPMHNMVISLS